MDSKCVISLPIDNDHLEKLVEDAKDFAFARGIVMKASKGLPYSHSVTFIPFTLLPSPFSKEQFDVVYHLQKDINSLYYRVTNDYEFLKECLRRTIEADNWTRRLWQIYERTRGSQKDVPSLAIIRSDYMIGQDGVAKQVEVNTVSAGFGGVSPIVRRLHTYVLGKIPKVANLAPYSAQGIAQALAKSWSTYVEMHNAPEAVICFAVEDVVFNTYDQRHIELILVEKFAIPPHKVVRKTNSNFASASSTENGPLIMDGQEVAVVYLRTWYSPSQIPNEEYWEAREVVERSRCIKCPNLAWQLAGCKKVQQVLSRPGILEKFCDDENQVKRIRNVFVGLYALEDEKCYQMVLSNPEKYVVKPQREGGGNNIFGADIPSFLKELPENQRKEFIAMEIINAPSTKNYLISRDAVLLADVVNELGIFGCVLASTQKTILNEMDCGWIFRTKDVNCKESGIAAGFGHLDSPYFA